MSLVLGEALVVCACSSPVSPQVPIKNAPLAISDLATSPEVSVRIAAAQFLGQQRDSSAVEPLLEALKDDSVEVRAAVAAALGEIGSPGAVDALCELLSKDHRTVKKAAAPALAKLQDSRAASPLVRALSEIPDDASAALVSLDELAVPALIAGLREAAIRAFVIEALAAIGPPAVGPLVEAFRGDPSKSVRLAAAEALGEINDPRAVAVLDDAMRSASPELTAAVHRYLIRKGTPEAERQLLAAFQTHGTLLMAAVFARSGNTTLAAAATEWARKTQSQLPEIDEGKEGSLWGKWPKLPKEVALFHFDGSLDSTAGLKPAQAKDTSFASGKWGQALAIAPKGGLSYPLAGTLDFKEGTVEMWIAPRFDGAHSLYGEYNHALLIYAAPRGDQFLLAENSLRRFYAGTYIDKQFVGVGGGDISGWKAGDWHHVAFTYSAKGPKRLFIDGTLIGELAPPMPLPQGGTPTFSVDSDPYGNSSAFFVDELRIFDGARSPAAIQADAARRRPASSPERGRN